MNNQKTYTCRVCGEPTTAHKEGCAAAPKTNGPTAEEGRAAKDTVRRPQYNRPIYKREGERTAEAEPEGTPATRKGERWSDDDKSWKVYHLVDGPRELTIGRYTKEQCFAPGQRKPTIESVIYFKEDPKFLIMNAGRRAQIAALFGIYKADVVGQRIVIAAGHTADGRESVVVLSAPKVKSVIVDVGEEEVDPISTETEPDDHAA